jgi:hypothetical protein
MTLIPRRRSSRSARLRPLSLLVCALAGAAGYAAPPASQAPARLAEFRKDVQPLINKYCSDCHADGAEKGNVAFDQFPSDDALVADTELWFKVLKNVRAGVMPPAKKPQPTAEEKQRLATWIKYGAFGLDPSNPDPGRVTLHRLNRVEYRNTIQDLMGIDFNTTEEFPPDDTGYGFDTIADVLSVSPLLLEKYMQAAEKIVAKAVPTVAKFIPETTLTGKDFKSDEGTTGERFTFYKPARLAAKFKAAQAGSYKVTATLTVRGDFDFDPGRCNLVLKIDGKEQVNQDFAWNNTKAYPFELPQNWEPGEHHFTVDLKPIEPRGAKPLVYNVPQDAAPTEKKTSPVDMMITSVRIEGPLEEKHWKSPKNYDRFFTRTEPPTADPDRRLYAKEVLTAFATRAFRRPADDATVQRLVKIAESVYTQPGKRFEHGIAQAIVATLSSPRFLFRVEKSDIRSPDEAFSPVDEYALASRLSYFLWSTMPDAELFDLARRGELRKNLAAQVKRLVTDPRSKAFVENFTGQWVQGRDVDGISIDVRSVLARDSGQEKELERQLEELRKRFAAQAQQPPQVAQANPQAGAAAGAAPIAGAGAGQGQNPFRASKLLRPTIELDTQLRNAMRLEPEMFFANIVREDRSLAELIDADYTYLNAKLAKHYGITGVKGEQMQKVTLPKDSPRGGLLTMGSVLVVTSNPTRTSPVKRGQFILDNILGMPSPPPPAEVPALEEAEKGVKDREPTVRETLQIHRDQPLCQSCHSRMDPLGLSLENFNPLGMYREKERNQDIDASGELITGEKFHDVRDLKKILKANHLNEFYRCLTEKVLTYALGRGLDYYDVEAVDRIVDRLEKDNGKFSTLLSGVIESAPFQKRRNRAVAAAAPATRPVNRPATAH